MTTQELATVIVALQVWRLKYAVAAGVEEIFNAQFYEATPSTEDVIDDLGNKLKRFIGD